MIKANLTKQQKTEATEDLKKLFGVQPKTPEEELFGVEKTNQPDNVDEKLSYDIEFLKKSGLEILEIEARLAQLKPLENRRNELVKQIKDHMETVEPAKNKVEVIVEGIRFFRFPRAKYGQKGKLDDIAARTLAKARGFFRKLIKKEVKVIETIDEQVLNQALESGRITAEELASLYKNDYIANLKIEDKRTQDQVIKHLEEQNKVVSKTNDQKEATA